ncbi:hypothetical protein ACIA5A_06105 [Micromonospora sp. NPDC051300]|uniref:hypothetical protein n=1 Tax=Micromonospora sp. NPDC051300 TaxID=3364286 RepID=UPI0037B14F9E
MDPIFWVLVFALMLQRGVTDGLYAYRGKPNPRYELKKARAQAAGQPVPAQPRYMTGDWFKDLYSDSLAANTDRRRAKAKAKAQPVDDMLDVVAEPKPAPTPSDGKPTPAARPSDAAGRVAAGVSEARAKQRPVGVTTCDRCGREQHIDAMTPVTNGSQVQMWCNRHDIPAAPTPTPDTKPTASPDPTPTGGQPKLATVIPMFPILKETAMPNAEITGLPTAIAFAQGMANAHRAASTAGGEQYVAALRSFEVGDGTIATVASARELSAQAAAAWERAADEIGKQNTVKEAYQAVPDAGNKRFVTGE